MRKWLWIIGTTVLVLFIVSFVGGYWLKWGWTGFPVKTEWDWLNLFSVLAIPAAVGLGTLWFTRRQAQESEAENVDNQREAALQAYIDKMSELLLEKDLRQSSEGDEVRNIARVRTLTVLKRLDAERKGNVVEFLQETNLINKENPIVQLAEADVSYASLPLITLKGIDFKQVKLGYAILMGADLRDTDLRGTNLQHANLNNAILNNADLTHTHLSYADLRHARLDYAHLSQAYLGYADLRDAYLIGTDLSNADLRYVDLNGAKVNGADLSDANLIGVKNVTNEQLNAAKSLKGATMPDGSIHP